MKKFGVVALCVAMAIGFTGCGKKEVSQSEWEQLETQRSIANDNSQFNAARFRAGMPGWENAKVLARGDSTQDATCLQGDGWASLEFVDTENNRSLKIKCSTVSANLGCMAESDFKARANLAQQENRCNDQIPKNLKKIAG